MRREEILKKFMWGISILNSYIEAVYENYLYRSIQV